jgi:hypothetical protein
VTPLNGEHALTNKSVYFFSHFHHFKSHLVISNIYFWLHKWVLCIKHGRIYSSVESVKFWKEKWQGHQEVQYSKSRHWSILQGIDFTKISGRGWKTDKGTCWNLKYLFFLSLLQNFDFFNSWIIRSGINSFSCDIRHSPPISEVASETIIESCTASSNHFYSAS